MLQASEWSLNHNEETAACASKTPRAAANKPATRANGRKRRAALEKEEMRLPPFDPAVFATAFQGAAPPTPESASEEATEISSADAAASDDAKPEPVEPAGRSDAEYTVPRSEPPNGAANSNTLVEAHGEAQDSGQENPSDSENGAASEAAEGIDVSQGPWLPRIRLLAKNSQIPPEAADSETSGSKVGHDEAADKESKPFPWEISYDTPPPNDKEMMAGFYAWRESFARREQIGFDGGISDTRFSTAQVKAIDFLVGGLNVTDTAEAVGVSRRTLHRWLSQTPLGDEFRRRQRQVTAGFRNRLAGLAERAVEVFEKHIGEGSVSEALGLLRTVGLLRGRPLTETDDDFLENVQTMDDLDPAAVTAYPESAGTETTGTVTAGAETAAAATVEKLDSAEPAATTNQREDADGAALSTCQAQVAQNGAPSAPSSSAAAEEREPFHSLEDLPVPQQGAIYHLMQGLPWEEVARATCVSRHTLARWSKTAPFRYVLRQCREDMQRLLHMRLVNLLDAAIGLIERELRHENGRVALSLIRGLGLGKPA